MAARVIAPILAFVERPMSTIYVNSPRHGGGVPQYYLTFNGSTSTINFGSNGSLDNLWSGARTIDGWFLPASDGNYSMILAKYLTSTKGWYLRETNASELQLSVQDVFSDVVATTTGGHFSGWCHVALVFDGTNFRIWLNGTLRASDSVGFGLIHETTANLTMGSNSAQSGSWWAGAAAWLRISNGVLFTTAFTPPAIDEPPAIDANTIEQWNFNDGSGTTATAEVNSSNNGTITDGSWTAF